ncbi:Ribose 1,5-bisphosphate isomerase [uncultured archaeon]|nr:Ribose 1,5-bisphosphate isomerase [uncultured archaeon]
MMAELTAVQETARKIQSMEIRGALDIALAASEAILKLVDAGGTYPDVAAAGKILSSARPTAVSLPNAVNYCLYVAERSKGETVGGFKKNVGDSIRSFVTEQRNAKDKIAQYGSNLISDGEVILTHCNSDTVIAILTKAQESGKKIHVYATETRPRMQGHLTVKALVANNVPATLIVDSAVHHVLKTKHVDKVIVGADTVYANGDVINKIGTSQVALCAHVMDVDFIVASQTLKFSPESVGGARVHIEERDVREVADFNVPIYNPAFDITPHHYIDAIVTEYGVIPPEAVYPLLSEKLRWLTWK